MGNGNMQQQGQAQQAQAQNPNDWFGNAFGGSAGDIANTLIGNQLGGLGTAADMGNQISQGMLPVNMANQNAAMYNTGVMGNLANTQMQQGGAFARELAALPILGNMSNALGSGAGQMQGFQSTNSPQAASLPASGSGASGANAINPNTYISQTLGQLGGSGGGPNALGFLGYGQGGWSALPGSGGTVSTYKGPATSTLAQLLGGNPTPNPTVTGNYASLYH